MTTSRPRRGTLVSRDAAWSSCISLPVACEPNAATRSNNSHDLIWDTSILAVSPGRVCARRLGSRSSWFARASAICLPAAFSCSKSERHLASLEAAGADSSPTLPLRAVRCFVTNLLARVAFHGPVAARCTSASRDGGQLVQPDLLLLPLVSELFSLDTLSVGPRARLGARPVP